jgi:hypothetical protein
LNTKTVVAIILVKATRIRLQKREIPTGTRQRMDNFKVFCVTIFLLVRQVLILPQTIATAFQKRRRQAEVNESEVERLDRLRNPSKYQGK